MLKNVLTYPIFVLFICISSICSVSKSDQTVSEIQTMLKDQGYRIGVIDGKKGKNTTKAIKNWQYLNAFVESGNINQEQLNVLRNQHSFGKTLSNEEMKVVEERNKKVIEKNKKASAVKKKSNIQKSNNEISFFSWFPWLFWSILVLFAVTIISIYYDKSLVAKCGGVHWSSLGFDVALKDKDYETVKAMSRNEKTIFESDFSQIKRMHNLKSYDEDYKYFLPYLVTKVIYYFLITICCSVIVLICFLAVQYFFFNINFYVAGKYSVLIGLIMTSSQIFIGAAHDPRVGISIGREEDLIIFTVLCGLVLHFFLYIIGYDYLLNGKSGFYFLGVIFFILWFYILTWPSSIRTNYLAYSSFSLTFGLPIIAWFYN